MIANQPTARLTLERAQFGANYNGLPFGFAHNLPQLDLFTDESLCSLCRAYADHPRDFFVAGSAADPATVFYSVPCPELKPHELTTGSYSSNMTTASVNSSASFSARFEDTSASTAIATI
jgi:hypothetical protein